MSTAQISEVDADGYSWLRMFVQNEEPPREERVSERGLVERPNVNALHTDARPPQAAI
jgi:hypothetical protein